MSHFKRDDAWLDNLRQSLEERVKTLNEKIDKQEARKAELQRAIEEQDQLIEELADTIQRLKSTLKSDQN